MLRDLVRCYAVCSWLLLVALAPMVFVPGLAALAPNSASASDSEAISQKTSSHEVISEIYHSAAAVSSGDLQTCQSSKLQQETKTYKMTERSYVMIKPDGVQRGLVGEIIGRFERKGFVLRGLKLFQCPKELAEEHYKDLADKPFYKGLVDYIISGPVVAMAWEGKGVVASARKLIGATNPLASEPGTIRGDLAVEVGRNVVHGSDSVENGEREIGLWFKEAELIKWDPTLLPWLRE